MKRILFLLCLALSMALHAAEYPAIVAFGDSLTDMGNRWIKSRAEESKVRATWVKQLAGPSMLKLAEFKVAGMTTYLGGTNYAVGGATTAYTAKLGSDRNRGQNLTEQVTGRYLNPVFNTEGVKKDALHVIVMGTNDLMLASIGLEHIANQWANFEKVGPEVARSTESQIAALAGAGVTRVLWGNLFDTGQAPSVVAKAKMLSSAMAPAYFAALKKAVIAHNVEMDKATARLEQAHPGLRIIKLDLFAKFADVVADPAKYGFSSVTEGANDAKHLFSADGLHPTPQGHKMLAEYAYAVLSEAEKAPSKPGTAAAPAGTKAEAAVPSAVAR
jgi:phospholipase/lecithinase/hemolysin